MCKIVALPTDQLYKVCLIRLLLRAVQGGYRLCLIHAAAQTTGTELENVQPRTWSRSSSQSWVGAPTWETEFYPEADALTLNIAAPTEVDMEMSSQVAGSHVDCLNAVNRGSFQAWKSECLTWIFPICATQHVLHSPVPPIKLNKLQLFGLWRYCR